MALNRLHYIPNNRYICILTAPHHTHVRAIAGRRIWLVKADGIWINICAYVMIFYLDGAHHHIAASVSEEKIVTQYFEIFID